MRFQKATPAEPPVAVAPTPEEESKALRRDLTLSEVLAIKDKTGLVPVRIPRLTRAGNIQFQPIRRNRSHVFYPGETYWLTPEVAEDIQGSIDNFEQSIVRQMTAQDQVAPEVRSEMEKQTQADMAFRTALNR